MKLKDIARTATFAWDRTSSSSPLLVTGAISGALDESFSNESSLEIWAPDFGEAEGVRLGGADGKGPLGSITVSSRFNRLAWSAPSSTHPKGVIAAGMETGEVHVYDPEKIIAGKSAEESRIFTSNKHTGPVRGLDFNPIQKNLLASGAVNAEIFIYDLNNPNKEPVPPGPVSNKLGEITSLQWNPTVSRILAASSSSGYTSVWDLKAAKEIVSLQYGGGAAKGRDAVAGGAGLQVGKRRGMSDVCWHPEQSTRLITSSEDDESPIIMLWDLRNTRAPERILSGHSKGVLSVSWCQQDADLLLSCGKDNRTLCWNPQSGEIIGELPATNDWSFQTTWCPRNPDLLATASFDGHIGIHSLQTTHIPESSGPTISETATADDVFGALGEQEPVDDNSNVLSLKQPPKWLRRPISATFGYGGLLATTSNLPGASGKHQSGVVHLRNIVTEQTIIDRAEALGTAHGDKEKLADLCNQKVDEDAAWKTLSTLFKADSRDELIRLLGFSKDDVAQQVEEAIKQFPSDRIPTVTFAEPDQEKAKTGGNDDLAAPEQEIKPETTPSEISITSDTTKRTEATEITEQSLFDNEEASTPAGGADFFSSMAAGTLRNPQLDSVVPRGEVAASSVAATVGSRASSVRSEAIKENNNFHIYPSGEGDVDRLITQALVLGDFKSAVDLCLASERFADALLLAIRGGADLLATTQKAYFNRYTTTRPFLRVFQSIVTEDLADIVQNADLAEWKVVFVVLCTFAKDSDFANLAEQLGQRLQHRSKVLSNSDSPEAKSSSKISRGDATLCYLAARKLEKVVSIWIDEMREEEDTSAESNLTRYSAHANALQSFIEKVAVFNAATGYVDDDLAHPTESAAAAEQGARTYKLSGLYDRFYEYADLLATQGQVEMAARYVQMTPSDYKGTGAAGSELDKARDRLFKAAGVASGSVQSSGAFAIASASIPAVASSSRSTQAQAQSTGYAGSSAYQPSGYGVPQQQPSAPSSGSQGYAPSNYGGYSDQSAYAPPPQSTQPQPPQQQQQSMYAPNQQQPYQPSYGGSNGYPSDPQPQGYGVGYAPNQQQAYGVPAPQQQSYGAPPQAQTPLAPPPRANATSQSASSTPPPIPAAQRRDMPGWNDAPNFAAPPKRPQSALKREVKPAPIMSPFPMGDPTQNLGPGGGGQGMGMGMPPQQQHGQAPPQGPPRATPPPPRGQPVVLPPPPKGGPRPPSAQAVARQAMPAPPQAPPQGPPQGQGRPTPPPQNQSRPGPPPQQPSNRGPPPSQLAGPPPPGVMGGPPPPRALSPLGPGRPAQQPSMTSQFRPTPPPQQPSQPPQSRPDGLSGPKIAGPPPPGRASSAAGVAGPPPQIVPTRSTPSPRPTPPPSAPVKPTHPAGDRSHIPQGSKPIYETLSSELGRVKQMNHPPAIKKIVDDTERRLNILFDGLNNDSVPKHAVDKMHEISRAIVSKDANAALGLHVQLLTNSVGDMTSWAPGVKQLIRLGL